MLLLSLWFCNKNLRSLRTCYPLWVWPPAKNNLLSVILTALAMAKISTSSQYLIWILSSVSVKHHLLHSVVLCRFLFYPTSKMSDELVDGCACTLQIQHTTFSSLLPLLSYLKILQLVWLCSAGYLCSYIISEPLHLSFYGRFCALENIPRFWRCYVATLSLAPLKFGSKTVHICLLFLLTFRLYSYPSNSCLGATCCAAAFSLAW